MQALDNKLAEVEEKEIAFHRVCCEETHMFLQFFLQIGCEKQKSACLSIPKNMSFFVYLLAVTESFGNMQMESQKENEIKGLEAEMRGLERELHQRLEQANNEYEKYTSGCRSIEKAEGRAEKSEAEVALNEHIENLYTFHFLSRLKICNKRYL